MALSQYVAINFLTKFDKKGLERATKELKGFDKTIATGSFRLKAFAKAGGVAAAAGLAIFAKRSIDAALAQEKLDKQLQLTLASIGQQFQLPEIKGFIADLQRATNVTEEQLVPAFRQLVAQTGDVESSQYLLTKALDTSAGTGFDLSTVLDAITKAAIGNYKSIGTLGIGYTAAEAKAAGFTEVIQSLDKYAGSAEAQTKTFAGQLKSFSVSAGEATETLGQGFITAVSIIATGSDAVDVFGYKLEKVATQFADIFVGTAQTFENKGLGAYFDFLQVAVQGLTGDLTYGGNALQKIEQEGIKLREKRTMQERGYLGLSQLTIDALEQQRLYGKKQLSTDQLLAKIQKDILAREKALTKEKAAQAAFDKKKADLQAMFDIDKINLQAALSRKLTLEDEARVKIMQKLAEGTVAAVNEAQKYADVLKVIEDGQITTEEVEMLAKKWGMTNAEVLIYIQKLFAANSELQQMLSLMKEINNQKIGTVVSQNAFTPLSQNVAELDAATKRILALQDKVNQAGKIIEGDTAREMPSLFTSTGELTGRGKKVLPNNLFPMADGGIVTQPTAALIGEAGSEAVIPLDKMGGFGTTVNINVAGSVISEGELQSVIQDALYNLNRSGAVTQLTNLGR
jgi:hypothetical protein